MNLIELGRTMECEYDEEHSCPENRFPKSVRFIHCVSSREADVGSWEMHNIRYASALVVKMGEAEYIDEIMHHSMILIGYCPFCGKELNTI